MKYVPLLVDDPGTFAYADGQTFYNEKLAFSILEHASRMADEGYEISFEMPDEYNYGPLYVLQTATLYSLIDALNARTDIDPELQTYYQTYANQLAELTALPSSRENYLLRAESIQAATTALAIPNIEISASVETTDIVTQLEKLVSTFLKEEAPEGAVPLDGTMINALQIFNKHLDDTTLTTLWNAQNGTIEEQSAYLQDLKSEFQDKKDRLPEKTETQSVLDTLWSTLFAEGIEETIYLLIGRLLRYIFTMGDPSSKIIAFLSVIGLLAIKKLWSQYTKGIDICDQYIAENDELLTIPMTEYTYELRLKIINSHNQHIANLLTDIQETEKAAEGTNSGDMAELVEAVQDLKYNSESIDLGPYKINLHGRAIDIEGMG